MAKQAYKKGSATASLEGRRTKIGNEYQQLVLRVNALRSQGMADKDIARDKQVMHSYKKVHELEKNFNRSVKQYYTHVKPRDKNPIREKEYEDFINKYPPKRYTTGQTGVNAKKVDDIMKGVQHPYKFQQAPPKTHPLKQTEDKPLEQMGKEGKPMGLTDVQVTETKTKPKPKPKQPKETAYKPPVLPKEAVPDDPAPTQAPAPAPSAPPPPQVPPQAPAPAPPPPYHLPDPPKKTAEEQRIEAERRKAKEEQRQREAVMEQKARQKLGNYTQQMTDNATKYMSVNDATAVNALQQEAIASMNSDYGTRDPAGLNKQERKNLFDMYFYDAIQKHTAQDTVKGAPHPDRQDPQPATQDAGTQTDIPVFGDEDKDGDIDKDDYLKKFGGGMRAGKARATDAQIEEGIRRGKEEQNRARSEDETQRAERMHERGVAPATDILSGTKFAGEQAGIDREFFYTEPTEAQAQTGAPLMQAVTNQPLTSYKTSILDKFEQNTEDAGQMKEAKARLEKTLEELKREIECYHLLYEDKIKGIQDPDHMKLYAEALKSKDLKTVREHHKLMADLIRAYYKVSHLKLGVIMSAESVFGGQIGSIPSMAGSFGMGVPIQRGNLDPTRIDRKKGRDRYSNATAGEINVIRGGRNTGKAIRQGIPRDLDPKKYIDDIPYPDYDIADAFRPRSYMRRRAPTNPQVRLKTGKK